VLRRASTHVPRLCALASFGLVLADPRAATLLLPGWLVGILLSHVACLGSPDNDPHRGSSVRRVGEPLLLRSPFWRPALHVAVGALAGAWLVEPVEATLSFSRVVAWGMLAGVGPGCLLFMPGIRHLNASPGREAYFFLGLVAATVALGVTVQLPGDRGDLVVRLLAMVLAVPAANGAMKIVDTYGLRALSLLGALLVVSLPGPVAVLREVRDRPTVVRVGGGAVSARGVDEALARGAALVERSSRADTVLMLDEPVAGDALRAIQLLAGRALLTSPAVDAPRRRALQDALAAGDGTALGRVRGWPGLAGRPLWALHRGPGWPGFTAVSRHDDVVVDRAEAPDILLVTVSSLRADRVTATAMPHLEAWARSGLLFDSTISPSPETIPGLATILTGVSPVAHEAAGDEPVPTLAESLGARGYRTSAVVALPGHVDLLRGFEQTRAEPGATAEEIIAMGLVEVSRADPRPLFLWCHVADLELPYEVPADARTEATGRFPFPIDPDLDHTHYGVASFPPPPRRAVGVNEIDTATGLAQYDVLVRTVDEALSQLLTSVTDDDLVVVTAPHGTSLVEHQAWFHHGPDLFEPSVRVPLVARGAGLPVGPRAELTSLEDVAGLLLAGRLPRRDRVMLESGRRPGRGTGAAYDARIDPTSRGLAPRIWGERTATGKTLLTVTPEPGREGAGVAFDLERDPDEMKAFPADGFELRRIDTWRRQSARPPGAGDDGE